MSGELPEGWAWARLADVAAPRRNAFTIGPFGSSLRVSDYRDSGVPLVFVRDIRAERFGGPFTKYVDGSKAEELAAHTVKPGDLLVTKMGEPPGDTAIYPTGRPAAIITADCIKLTPDVTITSTEFLRFSIRSPVVHAQIVEQTMGVAQQKLSLARFKDVATPLAPLPEQHRIVEKVEALLEQVNRAKERLDRVPLILKRFRQAVLAAACSGELTHERVDEDSIPEHWRWHSLDDLIPPGGLFDGPFGSNLKTSDYCAEGIRVIRLENIQQLRFVLEKETFISENKYETLRRHTVGEGDIIFGSFVDDAVRVCILPPLSTKAIVKADCFCIRPRAELVEKEYLALQLACHRTRNALVEDIHGATRPRINTSQLRALKIPLCTMEEQMEICRRVRQLFCIADAIERRVQAATARANKLPQSILSKAFSGELVPTEAELARQEGRTYETAEALLKRVLAKSPDDPPPTKTKGRRARTANG